MIWHKLKQFWHSLSPPFNYEDNESLVRKKLPSPNPENQAKITIKPFELNLQPQPQISSENSQALLPRKNHILPPKLTRKTSQKRIGQPLTSVRSPQLPPIKAPSIKSEHFKQVIWKDCDDVYRPIDKPFTQFWQEANILPQVNPVYIEKKAYLTIINHLKSDLEKEQGGILFGNAYRDPEKGIYVKIVSAIAAPNTLATKAHLEFTAQTWQGIMDYAKKIELSENIVGWYHSHPNIGVFMSNTDLKTQEAFFYHPWSLSIVYDPVRHEIGYFLGKKAQPVRPVICNSAIV